MRCVIPHDITLGILAGGRATRLDGIDKAWLERDGLAQVVRWQRRFADQTGAILVSANRHDPRYAQAGLPVVADEAGGDMGPVAGLDALLRRCGTPWLLSLPVDLVDVNDCLLPTLCAGRGENGAFACDDDGEQPLVSLWNVEAARPAARMAIETGHLAIHALQAALRMVPIRLAGVRFGNLNTFVDLDLAGIRRD